MTLQKQNGVRLESDTWLEGENEVLKRKSFQLIVAKMLSSTCS